MIIKSNELKSVRRQAAGETIALRFGCYDILHEGHQLGIDNTARRADLLVLGIMPDEYVTRTKGPTRPVNHEADRLAAIDAASGVDYTFLAPDNTLGLARVFHSLRPDIYVEDEEYGESRLKKLYLGMLGVEYVIDHESRLHSTSEIIATLGLAEAALRSGLDFHLETPAAA